MMIRKAFLVAASVLVLLGVSFLTLIPAAGALEPQDVGPGATTVTTDFEVNFGETEEISDEVWDLDANIFVRSGGILYINNNAF